MWVLLIIQLGPAESTTMWRSLMLPVPPRSPTNILTISCHIIWTSTLLPLHTSSSPHMCEISPPLRKCNPWWSLMQRQSSVNSLPASGADVLAPLPSRAEAGERIAFIRGFGLFKNGLFKTGAGCDSSCRLFHFFFFFFVFFNKASNSYVQLKEEAISHGCKGGRTMYPCNRKISTCMSINISVELCSSVLLLLGAACDVSCRRENIPSWPPKASVLLVHTPTVLLHWKYVTRKSTLDDHLLVCLCVMYAF